MTFAIAAVDNSTIAGNLAAGVGYADGGGIANFADLTITIPFNNSEVLAKTFQKFGEQIAAVIVEAVPITVQWPALQPQPRALRYLR